MDTLTTGVVKRWWDSSLRAPTIVRQALQTMGEEKVGDEPEREEFLVGDLRASWFRMT